MFRSARRPYPRWVQKRDSPGEGRVADGVGDETGADRAPPSWAITSGPQDHRRSEGITRPVGCTVLCLTILGHSGEAHAHTPHDDIGDVVVSPAYANDHTVFVIVRNRLMRSTDGGTTWREIVRGLGEEGQGLARVAFAPTDPDVLYLTTRGDGVLRSDDGGTSWGPANGGLTKRHLQEVAISPASAQVALVDRTHRVACSARPTAGRHGHRSDGRTA